MRFAVALPIDFGKQLETPHGKWISGWPDSWVSAGAGLSRQFGFLGNKTYSRAIVKHLDIENSDMELSQGLLISEAVLVFRKHVFAELILIGDSKSEKLIEELRSVGLAKTKLTISKFFDLVLDQSHTVLATAVLMTNNQEFSFANGLMKAPNGNPFAFDVTNSLMIAAIGAERIILEAATECTLQSDFFAISSRRHNSRLQDWLTVPSSDSTQILEACANLRQSLYLDDRHSQLKRIFRNRVEAFDLGIATFIGGLSLLIGPMSGFTGVLAAAVGLWIPLQLLAVIISGTLAILVHGVRRRK